MAKSGFPGGVSEGGRLICSLTYISTDTYRVYLTSGAARANIYKASGLDVMIAAGTKVWNIKMPS
jgi:hypothetical protein